MKSDIITLFCIDGQNGFCNPAGALYVPGAQEDIENTVKIIKEVNPDNLVVSGDMHPANHISFNTQWVDNKGNIVAPFTAITLADLQNDTYSHIEGKKSKVYIESYLNRIEMVGKTHVVFPPHCIANTWESCFEDNLREAISAWEIKNGKEATYVYKGQHAAVEQFSVFHPEVWINKNLTINDKISFGLRALVYHSDYVLFTLEAGSHCTGQSVIDAVKFATWMSKKIIWVKDAISPVPGFEKVQQEYINTLLSRGGKVADTKDILGMSFNRKRRSSSVERARVNQR